MAVMSLVAVVGPRTGKIIKSYKMVYYTLCLDSVNRHKSRWKFGLILKSIIFLIFLFSHCTIESRKF